MHGDVTIEGEMVDGQTSQITRLLNSFMSFTSWTRLSDDFQRRVLFNAYKNRCGLIGWTQQQAIDLMIPVILTTQGKGFFVPKAEDVIGIFI